MATTAANGEFPMMVVLQRRGKPRAPGEMGALHFQRWLGECRARGLRVYLAYNQSHCYAEEAKK